MKRTIMDAGPLVARLCPKDEHHKWAVKTFDMLPLGVLTCEAVLAEVCHMVAKDRVPVGDVLKLIERGGLTLVPLAAELRPIRALLDRYANTPMDFADACVVRLAELYPDITVCTTDGHFKFFRKHGREPIPLIAPFAT